MKLIKLQLKPGKEESLKRFHPWIFSGAIARFESQPEEGEIVEVIAKLELYASTHSHCHASYAPFD